MSERRIRAGVDVRTRAARDGETAPNGKDFHVRVIASTESIARDGGVIPMSAWEDGGLDAFRQNPVVLFAHSHRRLPVAKAVQTDLRRSAGKLVEWWRFHEETELSQQLRELYSRGFMRAASVGFRLLAVTTPTSDEGKEILDAVSVDSSNVDWVATEAELLETSAVSVPADPEALAIEQSVEDARLRRVETDAVEENLAALRRACRQGDQNACRRIGKGRDDEDFIEIEVREDESETEALARFLDGYIDRRLSRRRARARLREAGYL